MTLAGGDNPPVNDRSKLPSPASVVASVFPYVLGFTVSNDGSEITGVLLTGQASQTGTVLGLRGTVVNPSAAGLYSTPLRATQLERLRCMAAAFTSTTPRSRPPR